jgi:hypothetical protein
MHRSLPCELAARARANLTGINPAIGVQDYASNCGKSSEVAMTSQGALEALLSRVRDWWRRHNEFSSLDPKELERVAAELGMSSGTLEDLVARGPDAAVHLFERLAALGLSQTEVERAAQGVLRDLQRTCTCCDEKGRCEKDLRNDPAGVVWKDYCPNAATLDALVRLKDGRALRCASHSTASSP